MMKVIARAVIFLNNYTEVDEVIAYCESQLVRKWKRNSDSYISDSYISESACESPQPVPFAKEDDSVTDQE